VHGAGHRKHQERHVPLTSPAVVEGPRLYSKQARIPVDEVAPEHEDIHIELDKWARWNMERYKSSSLCSVESLYQHGRDGTPPATAPVLDLRSMAIEVAVLKMRSDSMHKPYSDTIRMFYVQRKTPSFICRFHALKHRAFPSWMFTARHLVMHHLRIVELR
jgi:hypothetical protein